MKKVVKNIIRKLGQRPLLTGLMVVLGMLTVVNLKPDFYLMGWDNYSSYFNLNNGIFRTLFGSWREYRGLGVPSDAEVTDIFRMIFYGLTRWLVPEGMLDQVFHIGVLWAGVLGIYLLAGEMAVDLKTKKRDLVGGLAGLLYLFNLNTLSVFYSPLIPFTNRFFGLPLLLWATIRLGKNANRMNIGLFIGIVLVSAGSYVTPTVIITNLIALAVFGVISLGVVKSAKLGLFYLLLNFFWLLPFVNYTREKSAIVPLARTFVEINESTLNRPGEVFSLEKQLVMYPSFFDMKFSSIDGKDVPIHPLLSQYQGGLGRYLLWLYPALYLVGVIVIIGNRDLKKWRWVVVWIVLFLFLSTKEFGIFGAGYVWLKNHLPFFAILFRISDTKFHAYINLAGSLAGAAALVYLTGIGWKSTIKKVSGVALVAAGVGYLWLFRGYLGNLIGFFAYTKLPGAYVEVARIINRDKDGGRVLHLPMSLDHQYWRSYAWGYLGSAFFDFMINKPYIDKTFEPASMENVYLNTRVNEAINAYFRNTDPEKKEELLDNWVRLLKRTGVGYVLVDNTISSKIYMRNMTYSTLQFGIRARSIMEDMRDRGLVTRVGEFKVDYDELRGDYQKLYPVNKIGYSKQMPTVGSIELYKINRVEPMLKFEEAVRKADINFSNILEIGEMGGEGVWRQSQEGGAILPFLDNQHQMEIVGDQKKLVFDLVGGGAKTARIETSGDRTSRLIEVMVERKGQGLEISFYHRFYPDINGDKYSRYLGSMSLEVPGIGEGSLGKWVGEIGGKAEVFSNYRVSVNGIMVPLPWGMEKTKVDFGAFIIEGREIELGLYKEGGDVEVREGKSGETCYGPRLEGYQGKAVGIGEDWKLESTRGSVCINKEVILPPAEAQSQYVEMQFRAQGRMVRIGEKGGVVGEALGESGEGFMRGFACIKRMEYGPECLNMHRQLKVFGNEESYIVPIAKPLSDSTPLVVEVGSVPGDGIRQSLNLREFKIVKFEKVGSKNFEFEDEYPAVSVKLGERLEVGVPKIISANSYNHHSQYEAMTVPMETCKGGGDRTMVSIGNIFINRMEKCSVYMAQPVVFNSNSQYLLAFEYWLGSGQQPHIVVGRSGDDYLTERVSLNQGYPNIEGSRTLLDPQSKKTTKLVKEALEEMKMVPASRLIGPVWRLDGSVREANVHIFQDTDNEGVVALGEFSINELPGDWKGLALVPEGVWEEYNVPREVEYWRVMPSWWKVKYEAGGGKSLLTLNQGYDRQWTVWGKNAKNGRCYGFNNCFELETTAEGETLNLIYWPEVLSWIGWTVTLGVIGLSLMRWSQPKKVEAK